MIKTINLKTEDYLAPFLQKRVEDKLYTLQICRDRLKIGF